MNDPAWIAETLEELLGEQPHSEPILRERLARLRIHEAFDDLLDEFFLPDREGWRLRSGQRAERVEDRRPSLTEEQAQWLKNAFRSRLANSEQPLKVHDFLNGLTEEQRRRLPFTWLVGTSHPWQVRLLTRLLRHDARLVRYDGDAFGLAEWDDVRHARYWWSALEESSQEGDGSRFERCAAKLMELDLPEAPRQRLRCVVSLYRRNLGEAPTGNYSPVGRELDSRPVPMGQELPEQFRQVGIRASRESNSLPTGE